MTHVVALIATAAKAVAVLVVLAGSLWLLRRQIAVRHPERAAVVLTAFAAGAAAVLFVADLAYLAGWAADVAARITLDVWMVARAAAGLLAAAAWGAWLRSVRVGISRRRPVVGALVCAALVILTVSPAAAW